MKCRYTKYLLWFMLGALISLVAYTRFFSENIADNCQHLHHQAHIALHNEKYEHVIEICDQAIKADTSPDNRYLIYVKKAKALNLFWVYSPPLAA